MTVVEQERLADVVTPEVTTADVLHRAADLLEEWSWRQCEVGTRETGMCALGAIHYAYRDLGCVGDLANVLTFAERDLSRVPDGTVCALARWNDKPGRTKEEVVARLRAAAEASR